MINPVTFLLGNFKEIEVLKKLLQHYQQFTPNVLNSVRLDLGACILTMELNLKVNSLLI
jgi:hypothetical protein